MLNEKEALNIVELLEQAGITDFYIDHDFRALYVKDVKKFADHLGLELADNQNWFLFDGWNVAQGMPQQDMSRYNQQIMELYEQRDRKGISEYGQRLEDNHGDIFYRIQHIKEELADALKYIIWLEEGLRNGKL